MPKDWADKYAGRFDDGWDAYRERAFARQKELGIAPADAELSRHDPDVPEWDSLSTDAKRLASRMMEVFAGFLSHTDHHIGPVFEFLRLIGEFDNTIVMFVSDNGASAEGGVDGTTNEAQFFNNAQETLEESLAVIDDKVAPSTSTTTRGAGPGPGTRLFADGNVRRIAAGPRTLSSSTGPRGSRRKVRSVTSTHTSSTWSPQSSTFSASRSPRRFEVSLSHRCTG